jgi:radical SAM superfamily enzyme YgiQ (UPF0313 family)
MRILLINPPEEHTIREWTDQDHDEFIEVQDYGKYPPLGLLYVLSYLEANSEGHELFFIDCVGEKKSHADLAQELRRIKPDIVGITSFTLSMIDCCLAAQAAHEVNPGCHVCLGGHHPIGFPFEAAQLEDFDSIVVGEGEVAFTELVNALGRGGDYTEILGVYTRESIERYRGKSSRDSRFLNTVSVPPAYIENLDSLPVPNRKWLDNAVYRNPVGPKGRMTTLISSRGCPFKCTFCDVPFKRYRKISVSRVLDDVEAALNLGFEEFHFYDDLFNITSARLVEFCDEIAKRNLEFSWDFRGRVNGVDRESLVRAKNAGCWMISFGVETGTDEGLKRIKKGTTTAVMKQAFEWCRELGIATVADFMLGFPFERNKSDVRRNFDYLLELKPDYLLLSILMLLPGTELYREAVDKGLIDPDKWREFARNPTPDKNFKIDYWTEHLSVDELMQLRKEGYRRFYMRPSYALKTALSVRSVGEFKRKLDGFRTLLRKGILSADK